LPLQKNEVLNFWPGAPHAPIGVKLNPQVFHATTDPYQISSRLINIWENGAQNALSADNRGRHAYGWSMAVSIRICYVVSDHLSYVKRR